MANLHHHVCHLSSVHTIHDNRILFKECVGLHEHGAEVSLAGASGHDVAIQGVRILSVPPPRNRFKRIFITSIQVARRAIVSNAEIYHFHDPELMPIMKCFQLMGKRVIFDMHENLPKAIQTKPWIPSLVRPLLSCLARMTERILLYRVPVVFAEASYVADYPFVREFAVVQNFPRLEKLARIESDKPDEFIMGYLGRISSARGSEMMVQALGALREEGRAIRMCCIGAGDMSYPDTLSHALTRHEYMPADEAYPIIAGCHVGMAILSPIPNYLESYPTKIFEYMAMGLPVITSNFPLYRDVVEKHKCGLCVDPTSLSSILDAIRFIMDNPDEAAAMGVRGREAAIKHYSWASQETNLLDLYRRVLE